MANKRMRFMWRAMTSVLMAISFLILLASGVVLFIAPPGRVANWTDWSIVGITKHGWGGLHICFAALFFGAAILHLIFNFRPMLNYFKNRRTRQITFRMEWVVALAVCLVAWMGTRADWLPFSSLLHLNETVKNSWEEPATQAPIPHAELFTLTELAEQAGITLTTAVHRLEAEGFTGMSPDILTINLATSNDISAQRIYEIIQGPKSSHSREGQPGSQSRGHGGGTGWKTLAQYCTEIGLDVSEALSRLEAKGIKASTNQVMRDIALENGFDRPFELVEILNQ